jgi:hypothetical protein
LCTDNSTLIGLLQVAQQAIKPQTLALSFSRQFAKRYLNKWEDKTNIKVHACVIPPSSPGFPFWNLLGLGTTNVNRNGL